ncbi:hypothetical protein D3C86_1313130 [compost metagenome]
MAQAFEIVGESGLDTIGEVAIRQPVEPLIQRLHDHLQGACLGLPFRKMRAPGCFGFFPCA